MTFANTNSSVKLFAFRSPSIEDFLPFPPSARRYTLYTQIEEWKEWNVLILFAWIEMEWMKIHGWMDKTLIVFIYYNTCIYSVYMRSSAEKTQKSLALQIVLIPIERKKRKRNSKRKDNNDLHNKYKYRVHVRTNPSLSLSLTQFFSNGILIIIICYQVIMSFIKKLHIKQNKFCICKQKLKTV